MKKILILLITLGIYAVDVPDLSIPDLDKLGLSKLADVGEKIGIDKLEGISEKGLQKLDNLAESGLDKVVEITPLDKAEGISLSLINEIKVTEALKKMGVPANVANIAGFPFDVVATFGKEFLRQIVTLPSSLIDTTQELISFVKDPQKAADLARRWFELFIQLSTMQSSVHLCHGGCDIDILLRFIKSSEPLENGFEPVKNFLEKNKDEVLFIFFEDYIKNGKKVDAFIENAGLQKYILKPSDWDITKEGGWPTFGWARKNNKRLIIFTSSTDTANTRNDSLNPTSVFATESQYVWLQWPHVAEGGYSDLDLKKLCTQRGASANFATKNTRYFSLLNLFPEAPISLKALKDKDLKKFFKEYSNLNNSSKINSFNNLKKYVETCRENGMGTKKNPKLVVNRNPNFMALDYVDQGEPVKFINWLNQKSLDAIKENKDLNTVFTPMVPPTI